MLQNFGDVVGIDVFLLQTGVRVGLMVQIMPQKGFFCGKIVGHGLFVAGFGFIAHAVCIAFGSGGLGE